MKARSLRDDVFDDLGGVDAGELLIEAEEGEGEAVVIDPQLVKNGGVEVAHGDFVFDNVVGVFVGLAVGDSAFDSAACHPGGEATGVVIATVLITGEIALAVGGASEFAGEDDEGVIEHAALFEVAQETGARLINVEGLALDFSWKADVVVPAAVEELDEADAALGHAAGKEAVAGEGAGL